MLIKVKVFAGSKKESVLSAEGGSTAGGQKTKTSPVSRGVTNGASFVARVKEKAERGEANRAVRRALANYLKVSPAKIRLIKGARQPSKIFEVK